MIHDFWVPRLGPKDRRDPRRIPILPGFRPTRRGLYLGTCAEYCGAEHAWMRIRVIAQTPEDFAEWTAHQQQPAASPSAAGHAGRGAVSGAYLHATATHRRHQRQGDIGPDLTHLGSRQTLAAGVLKIPRAT